MYEIEKVRLNLTKLLQIQKRPCTLYNHTVVQKKSYWHFTGFHFHNVSVGQVLQTNVQLITLNRFKILQTSFGGNSR